MAVLRERHELSAWVLKVLTWSLRGADVGAAGCLRAVCGVVQAALMCSLSVLLLYTSLWVDPLCEGPTPRVSLSCWMLPPLLAAALPPTVVGLGPAARGRPRLQRQAGAEHPAACAAPQAAANCR